MTRFRALLGSIAVLVVPVTGCSRTPAVDVPPISSAAADSLRDDLVQHGLTIPTDDRAAARAALGLPDSTRSRVEPNRHVPALTDSIVEWFYPGLRLEYRVVGAGQTQDLLSVADVRDNRYLKHPVLGVGATVATVLARLGEPQERTDGVLVYACGSCLAADAPVEFHVVGGRVGMVRFGFYVD